MPLRRPVRSRTVRIYTAAKLYAVALIATVWSCDRSPTEALARRAVNPAYVVGRAAEALDPHGQFVLNQGQLGTVLELSENQALALATVYVHTYGRSLEALYTEQHGSQVHVSSLSPCGHAYYAATPYESIPQTASTEAKKLLGPKWLIEMCGPGGPSVMVAVSSLATDLRIEQGHIRSQPKADFTTRGVSKSMASGFVTPEEAVTEVAHKTGRRVSESPELVLAPYPYSAFVPKWKITLDGAARLQGQHSRQASESAVVYMGFGGAWSVKGLQTAEPHSQPRYSALTDHGAGQPGQPSIALSYRSEFPAKYELVEVVR